MQGSHQTNIQHASSRHEVGSDSHESAPTRSQIFSTGNATSIEVTSTLTGVRTTSIDAVTGDPVVTVSTGDGEAHRFYTPEAAVYYLYDSVQQYTTEAALAWFRIGCVLAETKANQTLIARELLVNRRRLVEARQIAAMFNHDEELFLAEFARQELTWSSYVKEKLRSVRSASPERAQSYTKKLIDRAAKYITAIRDNPDVYPRVVRQLAALRATINRFVPAEAHLEDSLFVKYYDCTSCGAIAPPDGHHTATFSDGVLHQIEYAICTECHMVGRQPDQRRIAQLYSTYARNLEHSKNVLNRYLR